MIQTCTKQSARPYYIEPMDINAYSLEEINYLVYNHMNLIYRDFFNDALLNYLTYELDQGETAKKLRELRDAGASIKELIMCLFTESRYYFADDISKIADTVTNINNITRSERLLMEAGNHIKEKRYGSALHIFKDILNERGGDAGSDSFLAKVAFSAGTIYAKLFMCRNANEYFAKANEYFPDEMYARACVYTSIICEDNEELLRTIIKYKITDEELDRIKSHIEHLKGAISSENGYRALYDAMSDEDKAEKQIAKWKNEYYNMLS